MVSLLANAANVSLAETLPHAWVWGYGMGPGEYDYWYPDYSDNIAGLLSDSMNSSGGYGSVQGTASINGIVTLFASVRKTILLEAWAEILDTYRFYDLNNPGRTGAVPGLHAAITCSGSLIAQEGSPSFSVLTAPVYTKGSFSLSWTAIKTLIF